MIIIITPFNKLFTLLKKILDENKIPLSSSYQSRTGKFPCVVMTELSNSTSISTVDTGGEYSIDYSFEINIYSNSSKPISEVNNIMNLVDDVFSSQLNCNRDFTSQIPNLADDRVYRQLMRYSCVVDKNNYIYRR